MYKSRVQKHKEHIEKLEAQCALGCASFGAKLDLATSMFTSKKVLTHLSNDKDSSINRCARKILNFSVN